MRYRLKFLSFITIDLNLELNQRKNIQILQLTQAFVVLNIVTPYASGLTCHLNIVNEVIGRLQFHKLLFQVACVSEIHMSP